MRWFDGAANLWFGALAAVALAGALPTAARADPPSAPFIAPLDASEPIGFYIAPPPAGFRAADRELARWALRAWQRASKRGFKLRPASESRARIRLYWVQGNGSFGEMQPVSVNGQRGAAVFVRPVDEALGPAIASRVAADPLFRDLVLYLTCLHELGHALGLTHTRDFRDIMYSFGFGGDIQAYFARYRARVRRRRDLRAGPGVSVRDRNRLRAIYPRPNRHPGAGGGQAVPPDSR